MRARYGPEFAWRYNVHEDEACGSACLYGAVVRRFSKKLLGRVPEPLGVYWHNPAVLKATMGLGAKAER